MIIYSRAEKIEDFPPPLAGKALCALRRWLQRVSPGFAKSETIPGLRPGTKHCFAGTLYSRAEKIEDFPHSLLLTIITITNPAKKENLKSCFVHWFLANFPYFSWRQAAF